jgi:hypothetical protein
MTPPRLSEVGTELERGLLASARLDVSGEDGLKRTLVALGIGAGALSAGATTAAASVGTAGVATAAGGTTMLGSAGAAMLAKWVGIAVIVGGGAALSIAPSVHRMRAKTVLAAPPSAVPSALAAYAAAPVADPRSAAEVPLDVASSRPTPSASVQVSLAPNSNRPTLPVLRPRSSLPAELALLDGVRASLQDRNAPAALKQLDVYDRTFRSSILADEALVLRVDALVARGDRAEAAALSRGFLATHPVSPHAPHLLRLLSGAHNP